MGEPPTAYTLDGDVSAADLRERLAVHLDLTAAAAASTDRTVLDTFDARVRAAGLVLVHHGGRLRLEDRATRRELAAAPASRPSGPLRVADLPAGPLRERLAGILDVRAATPVARTRVRTTPLAVLDGRRKTVVRLLVEETAVTTGPRTRAPLAPRVRPVPVRGYDKALARVHALLGGELGLTAEAETVEDEAVRRAGGRPEGVSGKVRVPLERGGRADRAAVVVLLGLLDALEANLPGTLADVDPEFLHDLRVAVRRSRALQRELRGVFPPAELERFRADFKWLQAITGPVRDLDVWLLDLDDHALGLPDERRGDLAALRGVLEARRARERRRMVRELRSARTRGLLADWRAFLDGLTLRDEDDRPDAAREVQDVAARRIAKVYRRMVRMGGAIDDDSPPEALHDLRKKGKELRYLLEFFAALYPAGTVKPAVRTLKALQDTLGRFQDREVQAHMLRELAPEVASAPGGADALLAMGLVVDGLEAQQRAAREEFAERFAPFAAAERRAAMQETFG